jgi:hypothetical protein
MHHSPASRVPNFTNQHSSAERSASSIPCGRRLVHRPGGQFLAGQQISRSAFQLVSTSAFHIGSAQRVVPCCRGRTKLASLLKQSLSERPIDQNGIETRAERRLNTARARCWRNSKVAWRGFSTVPHGPTASLTHNDLPSTPCRVHIGVRKGYKGDRNAPEGGQKWAEIDVAERVNAK